MALLKLNEVKMKLIRVIKKGVLIRAEGQLKSG
jgi:hypothetical protein